LHLTKSIGIKLPENTWKKCRQHPYRYYVRKVLPILENYSRYSW